MKYDIYLMDADDTLFDFDKAEKSALVTMFNLYGLEYSEEIRLEYGKISALLWSLFEKGQIEKDDLLIERFVQLFDSINAKADANKFNAQYIIELGRGVDLIDGAKEICRTLYENGKKIYIVTNGASVSQKMRIGGSLIKSYVSGLFVSEDIGFQKPRKEYFDYVFSKIPMIDKSKVIIIGDSLTSDIQGGCNSGIDTCWFNKNQMQNPIEIKPTYQITKLREIALLQ